jgi:oligopeptide transport system ATP-binding protein
MANRSALRAAELLHDRTALSGFPFWFFPSKFPRIHTMPPLLDIMDLKVHFHTRDGVVRAVDGVSLRVEPGEVVGIVGESGSGKSITVYSLLGLVPMPPGRIAGGRALFQGTDLLQLGESQLRSYRGRKISMIFQDPMTSLNPYLRISTQLVEPLAIHENLRGKKALHRAIEALEQVGIERAATRIHSYPHEFSGGMRQRVMIAMALITRPDLLIADEPTTALDVTVQKQVLDVIRQLQRDTGTAVIFITHDLAVVHEMCDTVSVLYAGRVVERAAASDLIRNPLHAYTRGLYRSNPAAHHKGEELYSIPGMPPDPAKLTPGCAFRPRNTLGDATRCITDHQPELIEKTPGHFVQNCPGCLAIAAEHSTAC